MGSASSISKSAKSSKKDKKSKAVKQPPESNVPRQLPVQVHDGKPLRNGVGKVVIPSSITLDLPPPPEQDVERDVAGEEPRKFAWFVEDLDRPGEWELYPQDAQERLDEARRERQPQCLIVMKKRMCTVDLIKMEHRIPGGNSRHRAVKRVEVEVDENTGATREKCHNRFDPFAGDGTDDEHEVNVGEGAVGEDGTDNKGEEAIDKGTFQEEESLGAGERVPRLIRTVLPHQGISFALALSPDGTSIVTGALGEMLLWDVDTANASMEFNVGHGVVLHAVFSDDGQHILCGSSDGLVRLYNKEPNGVTFHGHTNKVYGVGFLAGQSRIATVSMDETLCCWDVETTTCIQTSRCHRDSIFALKTSSKNDWFAVSGGNDGNVYAHDFRLDGDVVCQRFVGHKNTIWTCSFRKDEQTIVSGGRDNAIHVWDVRHPSLPLHVVRHHTRPIHVTEFMPHDRGIISCGRDGTVRLTDAESGRGVWRAVAHPRCVFRVDLNEERRLMATSTGQCAVNIWEFSNSEKW